jgi:hypothetical protein
VEQTENRVTLKEAFKEAVGKIRKDPDTGEDITTGDLFLKRNKEIKDLCGAVLKKAEKM